MDARWCDLRLISCGYIGVFFHGWGVLPVLCRARGAGRVSGCLADVRPIRAVVASHLRAGSAGVTPRRRWRRPVPRSPGRSTPPQPETRLPQPETRLPQAQDASAGGDTFASAVTGVPRTVLWSRSFVSFGCYDDQN